jgi:SpoVK/Ycf46/Vps4 family AAA+-type ATPase
VHVQQLHDDLDLAEIACAATDGFSGSDLHELCRMAALHSQSVQCDAADARDAAAMLNSLTVAERASRSAAIRAALADEKAAEASGNAAAIAAAAAQMEALQGVVGDVLAENLADEL